MADFLREYYASFAWVSCLHTISMCVVCVVVRNFALPLRYVCVCMFQNQPPGTFGRSTVDNLCSVL